MYLLSVYDYMTVALLNFSANCDEGSDISVIFISKYNSTEGPLLTLRGHNWVHFAHRL